MWISRSLEPWVRGLAATRPVVVVTGARQTGKTSLARRLFPEHSYVSLDLPSTAAQAEHDPSTFLGEHPPPVVIDEVQYAPGLLRHVKRVVDQHRGERGQFILTGSQPYALMQGVAESLAGRAAVVAVEGLTYAETVAANPNMPLAERLLRGGFPELHADPSIDVADFMRSYVATYLERDLRSQMRVGSLRDFERFVRAAALRSAQLLNKAELARDVGVSGPTSAEWLSLLERGGIVTLLEPWFSNRGKSLIKTPKLYMRDVGLAAFLMGITTADELTSAPLVGAIWETFICGELRKALAGETGARHLHFWRDRTKEADFLVHAGGAFLLADAKWTEEPETRDAKRLLQICDELPTGVVRRMAIICRTHDRHPLVPGTSPVEAVGPADAAGLVTGEWAG
jgi:uncharacterized protein